MKNRLNQPMTRRAWMALTGVAVAGCGGGGSLLAALPGTGGTGAVFAQGSISGFGSVIVNGIKFDDLQAAVTLNGVRAASADLRLGMVAEIQGQRGADLTLGTAASIDVWTMAQGLVTALVSGGFVVSDMMTIRCDTATVLDGVANVGEIAVGDALSVWGLQTIADASQWTATRVARVTGGMPVVSSGLVRMMAGQPALNGVHLMGDAVANVMEGALVRVEGTLSASDVMQVDKLRFLDLRPMDSSEVSVEVEGFVTEMASARRFRMGSLDVDASAAVLSQAIAVGDRVEVYGYWNSGLLVASRVQIESEGSLQLAELTGIVTEFNSLADFVVRGERCDASQAVFSHGVATDLRKDVLVKVEGTRLGAVLRVDTLEFED